MAAYYNEFDPGAAAWLRELIARGLVAPGDVDTRSIVEVRPSDLIGYKQCHFFAGIGGWSLALRMAGVSDDEPIWTGSCPCQPFSVAGKLAGDVDWKALRAGGSFSSDERHLWPEFFRLIAERRPSVVVGEQASSPPGRAWLSAVRADLEGVDYAVGGADLCAAGIGAPHIRQRTYWGGRMADADRAGQHRVAERYPGSSQGIDGIVQTGRDSDGRRPASFGHGAQWRDSEWVACLDGKSRPLEPGLVPMAHGVPARVVRLRGYGNAIVPQVAATFVEAFLAA